MKSHSNARAPVGPPDWARAYLSALEVSLGQKIKAAKAANVTPRTVQRRRKVDAAFAAEEQDRMEVVKDAVESEITRRAIEGVTRKRYDRNGKLISEEIEYSDALLLRLAERTETGSWRQKQQIEHGSSMVFATRAERKAALEKARSEIAQQASLPVILSSVDEPSVGIAERPGIANWRASGCADIADSVSKQAVSQLMTQTSGVVFSNEARGGHLGSQARA